MQQITITLDLPRSERLIITIALPLSKSNLKSLEHDVRNTAIISLYKQGMISLFVAADLIGCNSQNFEEFFYKCTMMDNGDLDFE